MKCYIGLCHTFTKKTIVVIIKRYNRYLNSTRYSFAGKWVGGFLTNLDDYVASNILDNYKITPLNHTTNTTLSLQKYLICLRCNILNKPNHGLSLKVFVRYSLCSAIDYNLDLLVILRKTCY